MASNIVGCMLIFTIKRLPNGAVDRFKARFVAKGFHQRPGIDIPDTFSLVVKPATITQLDKFSVLLSPASGPLDNWMVTMPSCKASLRMICS